MSTRNDALEEAALLVLDNLLSEPDGEVEEHVNYVLTSLAEQIRRLKRP